MSKIAVLKHATTPYTVLVDNEVKELPLQDNKTPWLDYLQEYNLQEYRI